MCEFTREELILVCNGLNEFCHGIGAAKLAKTNSPGDICSEKMLLNSFNIIFDLTPGQSGSGIDLEELETNKKLLPIPFDVQWTGDFNVLIGINEEHILSIKNAIALVDAYLEDWEYDTRMGCLRENVKEFLETI